MAEVKIYKNLLAELGAKTSDFSFSVDAGGIGSLWYGMRHGYSNDLNTMAYGNTSAATTGYFQGGWQTIPSGDVFDAIYVQYGDPGAVGTIGLETADPEIGSWSWTAFQSVIGSDGVGGPVTSGMVVEGTGPDGWGLAEFDAVSSLRTRYRLIYERIPGEATVDACRLHLCMPLELLDLPEASRSSITAMNVYGASSSTSLGGRTTYASYGADVRQAIQLNYTYLREEEKDVLLDLQEVQRGSTYPFIVRINDIAYPVLLNQDITVIEEQAGIYNVSLYMETL